MTLADQMQRLEEVLSVYGADPARWPAGDRAELVAFVGLNADAAAMVSKEASFDAVLRQAPAAVTPMIWQGARDRLLARFEAETGAGVAPCGPAATVVPFAPRSSKPATAWSWGLWRELSVMAAALLIGFFTVSQGLLEGSGIDLSPLGSIASLSSSDAEDVSAIAFGMTGDDPFEEELL
jgi:hypothetical protein